MDNVRLRYQADKEPPRKKDAENLVQERHDSGIGADGIVSCCRHHHRDLMAILMQLLNDGIRYDRRASVAPAIRTQDM